MDARGLDAISAVLRHESWAEVLKRGSILALQTALAAREVEVVALKDRLAEMQVGPVCDEGHPPGC